MNIYIKTNCRSGSKTIVKFFRNTAYTSSVDPHTIEDKPVDLLPDVVTFHDPRENIFLTNFRNTNDWNFILSYREDTFDQICSLKILEYTNQDRVYSLNSFKFDFQIDLSLEYFLEKHKSIRKKEEKWRSYSQLFRTYTEISYEQLFEDVNKTRDMLFNKIGYFPEFEKNDYVVEKSPYDKENVIKDYYKLKKKFYKILNR